MSKKNILIIALSFFIGIGVGVYGGTVYQKKQVTSQNLSRGENGGNFQRGTSGQQRTPGQAGQRMNQNGNGGAFENGEVISKDDKSITIKTRDGGSKIIYFSNSTTVGKTVDGSITDLNIGNQVMVNGKNDSSGMITAENIQIRPDQKK